MPVAAGKLAKELLVIEATGDRSRAEAWFAKYDKMPAEFDGRSGQSKGRPRGYRTDLLLRRGAVTTVTRSKPSEVEWHKLGGHLRQRFSGTTRSRCALRSPADFKGRQSTLLQLAARRLSNSDVRPPLLWRQVGRVDIGHWPPQGNPGAVTG